MIKVAINGFGRIGRQFYRQVASEGGLVVVAINDLTPRDNLEYLLQYDSVYSRFDQAIPRETNFFAEKDPSQLPWKSLGVDVVVESTGAFTDREGAAKHLSAGAKKVLITAPAKDPDITIVLGVNHEDYSPKKHDIVSMASCTTNCAAPVIKILHDAFSIQHAFLTTVHAYTATQLLVDGPAKKDWRRGRAGAVNVIPTTTGAARAVAEVIPELKGCLDGVALRVPLASGSITDVVAKVGRKVTVEAVNEAFTHASQGKLQGILEVSDEGLVSSDIVGTTASAIVDLPFTRVLGGNLVKVMAWYDNEWAYASRLVDVVKLLV